MAISWGAWEFAGGNGMRVGIESSTSTVTTSSANVTFTVKYYTQNQYNYSDAQTLTYSGNITGTFNFTNNTSDSSTVLRDTNTHVYTYTTYGSSPGTRSFGATISGAYNGVTPQHTITPPIPARPYAVPTVQSGVGLARNSDTQATLTWTRNTTAQKPYTSQTINYRFWQTSGSWSPWVNAVVASSTATSYVKTGLSANNVYQFQIRANNSVGSSGYQDSGLIYMTPAAPSGVVSTLNSGGTSITTTWTDNAYTYLTTGSWTLQRSVAGAAFVNVGTVATKATRTFTDSSPGVGTNQYRVAAVQSNGPLTSAYATGNVVTTVAAPLAPTLLSPNGSFVDFVNDAVVLTWQHNPGGDGAAQTHYTVEFSSNSGSTWVAYVATNQTSAVSSHTVPAASLVNGVPYLWRVRTEGVVSAGFGPNSASAAVTGATKPTVTLTLPTATTLSFPIVAQWAYNQDELQVQIAYEALLFAADGTTLLEEIDGFSAATEVEFTYAVISGQTYVVKVRAQSSAGMWSDYDSETTAFTLLPPVGAIVTGEFQPCTGTVLLSLSPGTVTPGTDVEADSVTIERRVNGGEWVILGQGILIPTDFLDTLPLTNGLNEYRITAVSSSSSTVVGPLLEVYGIDGATDGDPLWAWLSYGDTFEFDLRVHGELAISETSGRQRAQQHFLGRARPVALVGANTTLALSLSGTLFYDRRCLPPDDDCTYDSHPRSWRAAGNDSEVVCYRDFTGRRIFGTLSDVQVSDGAWPGKAAVNYTVTEVDFTERYVQLVEA